ncbi:MAG: class II glutamine amidotransferase [Gemmatimonadaceae bacterium]
MCRFTLYLGPPVRLATLLTEPEHSLILQSYKATERQEPLNGDGFGIGWYSPRVHAEPGVFHQITPAWSNRNLRSMANVISSPCVLAHVRAATPGSGVDLANCHPFAWGNYLLMQNGYIGSFRQVRRRLLEGLTDEAYDVVRGSTDTEHLFAVFVDEIIRHGCPVDQSVTDGSAALELARRLSAAVTRVVDAVTAHGNGEPSYLNIAVADGEHAAVCRFATGDVKPDSLYLLSGEMYQPTARQYPSRRPEDEGESVVVSSERLTSDPRWAPVPVGHMVVLDRHVAPRLLPMDARGRIEGSA